MIFIEREHFYCRKVLIIIGIFFIFKRKKYMGLTMVVDFLRKRRKKLSHYLLSYNTKVLVFAFLGLCRAYVKLFSKVGFHAYMQ